MILRYCRLFQCPVLHKMPLSWGVWIVSGDVWMGSEGVWKYINSIDINSFNLIPNLLAKKYDRPWHSDIAFITMYCIKMHMSGGVWIVSGGVWMGSEFVWGCINIKSVGKNVYRSWQLRYSLFFQCLLIRKDAYVWGVSGWCLWVSDGVWIISRGVRQMSGGV